MAPTQRQPLSKQIIQVAVFCLVIIIPLGLIVAGRLFNPRNNLSLIIADRNLTSAFLVIGYFILIFSIALLGATIWLISRKLKKITNVARQITRGNFNQKITDDVTKSNDEVGALAQTFNKMIEHIHRVQDDLQDAKSKADAILLSIGDGVFAIDNNEKIILFNHAAEILSGYSAAEAIEKKYTQILRFAITKTGHEVNHFIHQALNGTPGSISNSVVLYRKDGVTIPVADSVAPITNSKGKIVGAVVIFRDVTHEREVNRLKTEFVSVASHQLRTPLTAIRWYLEDIKSGELGRLNNNQNEYLSTAIDSTNRMIRLVNNLLNVSRLETGRLTVEPAPTNMIKLIAEIVRENREFTETHNCRVKIITPSKPLKQISIDPTLIRQVIINLLSNAVKYAHPEHGSTLITITLTTKLSDLVISVRDNGMGIPDADKHKIFQKFFRADNAVKKEAEGTGLGLYIVKLIVENSGGQITFTSTENKGTIFSFTLPLAGSKKQRGERALTKTN